MKQKIFTNKAFTLIEILVVVLIIGILAAIAVPKYQKAVLKADLHRGISLVESLYQAQQAYYLTHGNFAADIDELDVSFIKDASCEKTTSGTSASTYDCDFGRIFNNKGTALSFQNKPNRKGVSLAHIAYVHQLGSNGGFKAGHRYCFAKTDNNIAKRVCQELGGDEMDITPTKWTYYEIK